MHLSTLFQALLLEQSSLFLIPGALQTGDEVVRRSKLNLVDLAGSERVTKSQLDGHVLKEAKYINLSLHYLEQVIIALQASSYFRLSLCFQASREAYRSAFSMG